MVLEPVLCPVCQQPEAVFRHGRATDGTQRYRCTTCRRTFQLRYRHQGHAPGVRARIMALAFNGSGVRDTARVLGISAQTVMAELKKRSSRCANARPGGRVTHLTRPPRCGCAPTRWGPS